MDTKRGARQQFTMEMEKMHSIHLRNAFLSPFRISDANNSSIKDKFPNAKRIISGCIYNGNRIFEPLSERVGGTGGDHVISMNPEIWTESTFHYDRIPGKSVFLGNLHWHYGHFITEGMSRLWFANQFKDFDNYIYTPFFGNENRLLEFHRYFLSTLGVDTKKVIILNNGAHVDDVFIPKQLWNINSEPDISIKNIYNVFKVHDINASKKLRRVFLSRRQTEFNRIMNVQAVNYLLQRVGFEIIYPEDLEISEQIKIYGSGCLLAGFPGTALHNVLFSHPNTKLLEIGDIRNPRTFHVMQKYCNEISEVEAKRIPYFGSESKIDISYIEEKISALTPFLEE